MIDKYKGYDEKVQSGQVPRPGELWVMGVEDLDGFSPRTYFFIIGPTEPDPILQGALLKEGMEERWWSVLVADAQGGESRMWTSPESGLIMWCHQLTFFDA